MVQLGKIIGLFGRAFVVIGVLKAAGYVLQMITVFNNGLAVAANGGNIAPYIEALVLIMVVAAIPGWLLTAADVDLG